MESASKALLIAGGILVILAVVGIAVTLANKGEQTLNEIGDIAIDNTLVANQRNKFIKYQGEVTAAQAKQCVSAVLAHNSNLEADEGYLAVTMNLPADITPGGGGVTATAKIIDRAKFLNNGGIANSHYIKNISTKIDNSYTYTVKLETDINTGAINKIYISRKTS